MFLQLLVNSLIAGSIYALVAAGFSLIYSTCKFVHFAHGAVVAAGGYLLYLFFGELHFNFWVSVILAIIGSGGVGYIVNLFIYEPLRRRKASNAILLIASTVVLLLIESILLIAFGADVKVIDYLETAKGLEWYGAIITPLQLVIIGVSVTIFLLLGAFLKYSKLGKAMRAVSDNKEVAEIVGIAANKIYIWAFIIGSALAGVAGILVAMEQNLEPSMGTNLIIKGFTGAVIGGIGSTSGALLGSFLLGIAENFGIWYLPSGYKDAIAFTLLILFLLFRPQGILGKKLMLGK